MQRESLVKKRQLRSLFLVGLIFSLVLLSSLIEAGFQSGLPRAYAHNTINHVTQTSSATCASAGKPDSQSLLVVLLDRSGSLTYPQGPTDPQLYSTSVTEALTDLWPGFMAVVAFSNDRTPVLDPGITQLSNPTQRQQLKNSIENFPIGGATPLDPAMQKALGLLKGASPGSRVILITDGNPDPATLPGSSLSQEDNIRQNLLKQFCGQGIPVSAFGLTIDTTTADGRDANKLLTDIANETNASYTNVSKPEELANAVISLYANWRGLSFRETTAGQDGNYPVQIDRFATQADIITFHADHFAVEATGPDNNPLVDGNGVQKLSDKRHYEIDRLIVQPIIPGTYTLYVNKDPDARVYALIDSPLQIHILQPTLQGTYYVGQPVAIQAEFVDPDVLTPSNGQAGMSGQVTLHANGRIVEPGQVIPTQDANSPVFSAQTKKYSQIGTLEITITGNYLGASRTASISVSLLPAPPPPQQPSPRPFTLKDFVSSPAGILSIIGLVLLLIGLLILAVYQARPKPIGWICSEDDEMKSVNLSKFKKAVIRSNVIQLRGNFNFGLATFDLEFDRKHRVFIKNGQGNFTKIQVGPPDRPVILTGKFELQYGHIIHPENGEKVSYQSTGRVAAFL